MSVFNSHINVSAQTRVGSAGSAPSEHSGRTLPPAPLSPPLPNSSVDTGIDLINLQCNNRCYLVTRLGQLLRIGAS
jgi:hypothetical protein